jgi:hypothetical protein
MVDSEVLIELKQKYGPLFAISIKGIDLLFRELTFEEFDKIATVQRDGVMSSAEAEDKILEATIVYPDKKVLDKIPAGAFSSIAQEILDASGFSSARTAKARLEEKRREVQTEVRPLMKSFVLATMPAYKPEDLDLMTFSELAERVALAEKIIEIHQTMNGMQPSEMKLDLIDPEEEAEIERQRAANYNASRKQGEAAYEDPVARKLWSSM